MFERFTEKARRVIFFAHYEASQYGSPYIKTEHLLLGLLREDRGLTHWLGTPFDFGRQVRQEIEKLMPPRERISTSVEVPLTQESKKVLTLAMDESQRLAHKHVGTEHLLLGMLRLPESLAGRMLLARGLKADAIREKIREGVNRAILVERPPRGAIETLDSFFAALRDGSEPAARYFHGRGQFIDASGKRWVGSKQIDAANEALFAPFAKKNAWHRLEDTACGPSDTVIASVLWELAAVSPAERGCSFLRMTIVLAADTAQDWSIVLAQITPFRPGPQPPK
jgi:hypothetical protein